MLLRRPAARRRRAAAAAARARARPPKYPRHCTHSSRCLAATALLLAAAATPPAPQDARLWPAPTGQLQVSRGVGPHDACRASRARQRRARPSSPWRAAVLDTRHLRRALSLSRAACAASGGGLVRRHRGPGADVARHAQGQSVRTRAWRRLPAAARGGLPWTRQAAGKGGGCVRRWPRPACGCCPLAAVAASWREDGDGGVQRPARGRPARRCQERLACAAQFQGAQTRAARCGAAAAPDARGWARRTTPSPVKCPRAAPSRSQRPE